MLCERGTYLATRLTLALIVAHGMVSCQAGSDCSQPFTPCTESHCCIGVRYRCFEKKNRFFAQCLPPDRCVPDPASGLICRDVEGLQLATSAGALSQPAKAPPPPPPRECTAPFQECTATHCCHGDAFRCFEKHGPHFAQCLRPDACVAGGADGLVCKDVEHAYDLLGSGECSQPFQSCSETKCCSGSAYGCYKRAGKAYAMCKRLPDGGAAACQSQPTDGWVCPGAWDRLDDATAGVSAYNGADGDGFSEIVLVLALGVGCALVYVFRARLVGSGAHEVLGRLVEALPEPLMRLVSGKGGPSETEMSEVEPAAEMEAATSKKPKGKKGKRSKKQFHQLGEEEEDPAEESNAGAGEPSSTRAPTAVGGTGRGPKPSFSIDDDDL